MSHLAPVVFVDEEKCVNCHACITACPVKFCIDGSGDTVTINHDLCIGCGSCIDACTHDARSIVDDIDAFERDLASGVPMVAVVAPAVAAHVPGNYLRLNAYLESRGISACFDVSFGAELTVKSYLEHIKSDRPPMVIAQPCPAIVSYIEIYRPELLPYLAPADSPMMHTIKMIAEYFPEFAGHSVVVISPCIAKRREFDDTGARVYNVTFATLIARMKQSGIDLARFPESEFRNPCPERAVLFSSPGGLRETVVRERPEYADGIRKIEGPHTIYRYLDQLPSMVSKKMQPLLVDCLNCELGCNGGTGTLQRGKSPDEIEYHVRKRRDEMQKRLRPKKADAATYSRQVNRSLDRYWKPGLYGRTYHDRSSHDTVEQPTGSELKEIYQRMHKYGDDDLYNCSACGYGSCEMMATAIHNGLNKPENCHYFKQETIEREQEQSANIAEVMHRHIANATELIAEIDAAVASLEQRSHDQQASLEESSAAIEEMVASITSAAKITSERKSSVDALISAATKGQDDLGSTIGRIETITGSVKGVGKLIDVIDDVAANTNLLAINAAIEAAHAGETCRGFSVVADEIRRLAEETAKNASDISASLATMIRDMADVGQRSKLTGKTVDSIIADVRNLAESLSLLTNTMAELSVGSNEITDALAQLNSLSSELRDSYRSIGESVRSMHDVMRSIGEVSKNGDATAKAAKSR
jgi:iron only hydrogenase large subunit-like protein